jgi:hypothetical protein
MGKLLQDWALMLLILGPGQRYHGNYYNNVCITHTQDHKHHPIFMTIYKIYSISVVC